MSLKVLHSFRQLVLKRHAIPPSPIVEAIVAASIVLFFLSVCYTIRTSFRTGLFSCANPSISLSISRATTAADFSFYGCMAPECALICMETSRCIDKC